MRKVQRPNHTRMYRDVSEASNRPLAVQFSQNVAKFLFKGSWCRTRTLSWCSRPLPTTWSPLTDSSSRWELSRKVPRQRPVSLLSLLFCTLLCFFLGFFAGGGKERCGFAPTEVPGGERGSSPGAQ